MALVDFYQLAVLHKLGRADPGLLSIHSRPLHMSDASPPPSPSPSVEPEEAHQSPSPSVQPPPTTPKRTAVRLVPEPTPLSRGSSIRQNQEGDTDRVEGYERDDYEQYIHEDLKSRVFVDYGVFLEYVLHVPKDWKTQWKPVIETIAVDPTFRQHYEEYIGYSNGSTTREELFYEPLAGMANAVLDFLSRPECSGIDGIGSGMPQTYRVNNPKKLQGGIFDKANLSPDLVVLPEGCNPESGNPHWANAFHILEVKPYGQAICDGSGMPRLVIDGECARTSSYIVL